MIAAKRRKRKKCPVVPCSVFSKTWRRLTLEFESNETDLKAEMFLATADRRKTAGCEAYERSVQIEEDKQP